MSPPEFSHIMKLDQIGAGADNVAISASAEARAGLAKRFDLLTLDKLEAELSVLRDKEAVLVKGRFRARLVQACVATGEPITSALNEGLLIRFQPLTSLVPDAEIELADTDCDVMELEGNAVDLGEAVAQSLLLALDPYPRSPNADALLKAAGVKQEDEVGAFSGLAALRDKLSGS